jgi:hypothetical protein
MHAQIEDEVSNTEVLLQEKKRYDNAHLETLSYRFFTYIYSGLAYIHVMHALSLPRVKKRLKEEGFENCL